MVFLTATILSVQHWWADAYLVVLATLGYGFALGGYAARRFRQEPRVLRVVPTSREALAGFVQSTKL